MIYSIMEHISMSARHAGGQEIELRSIFGVRIIWREVINGNVVRIIQPLHKILFRKIHKRLKHLSEEILGKYYYITLDIGYRRG